MKGACYKGFLFGLIISLLMYPTDFFLFDFLRFIDLLFDQSVIPIISRVLIALFFVCGLILFGLYVKRYSKVQNKKFLLPQITIFFLLFLFVSWISLQFVIVIGTELEFNNLKNSYSQQYISLIDNGYSEVDAAWEITNSYCGTYKGQYNNENAVIPSRRVILRGFNPVFLFYFNYFDGFSKINTIQNCGNCGEFAASMRILLKDITGSNTRIVHTEGIDHAIPEININNEWWVFDRIYTTDSSPTKEYKYASFLQKNNHEAFKFIRDLKEDSKLKSVLSEHGFNSSNLTITALKNTQIGKNWDDILLEGATVEVYILDSNSSDPLVAKGVTDENGNYSVILKKYEEYIVRVKASELTHDLVGIKEVSLSSNPANVVVDLKYEKEMDYQISEINVNRMRWLFDDIYTNDLQSTKKFNNSLFLLQNDFKAFNQTFILKENPKDDAVLFIEQGFNSSNLTLTAKNNMRPSETWDDELIGGATVEIYTLDDANVPLINKGMTDKTGNYSANLKRNKNYLIIVKSSKHKLIGIKEVFLSSNLENIVVDLKGEK